MRARPGRNLDTSSPIDLLPEFELPPPRTESLFDPRSKDQRKTDLWIYSSIGGFSISLALLCVLSLGRHAVSDGFFLTGLFAAAGAILIAHGYLVSRPFRSYESPAAHRYARSQKIIGVILLASALPVKLADRLELHESAQIWLSAALALLLVAAGVYYVRAWAGRLAEWFGSEEFLNPPVE